MSEFPRANPFFEAAPELAGADLYARNPFRLLELPAEAGERDLVRRRDWMEKAVRAGMAVPPGPARWLARSPPPDENEIRLAAHSLQDLEKRFILEFFWFWPMGAAGAANDEALRSLLQGADEQALGLWAEAGVANRSAAVGWHNLAVYHHLKALEVEEALARGGQHDGERPEPESHWRTAIEAWKKTLSHPDTWLRMADRRSALADASLPPEANRCLERTIPFMIAYVDARLAISAYAVGRVEEGKRHIQRLQQAGYDGPVVEEALRQAVEPTRRILKAVCDDAEKKLNENPESGGDICTDLLKKTRAGLDLMNGLFPADHPIRMAECDLVAQSAFRAAIDFGNKTEKWPQVVALLTQIAELAAGSALREKIARNQAICEENVQSSTCWICGLNPLDPAVLLEMPLYGEVRSNRYGNTIHTTWKKLTLKVPRCRCCHEEVSMGGLFGFGTFCAVIFGIITAITVGNLLDDFDFSSGAITAVVLLLLASTGVVGWLVYRALAKRYRRYGLKRRAPEAYPAVKAQLAQGWAVGTGPGGAA